MARFDCALVIHYGYKKQGRIKNDKAKDFFKRTMIVMGKSMAKVDTMTTCPWINYQPQEPEALKKLRQK